MTYRSKRARLRARIQNRVETAREYRFGWPSVLIGGLLVLIIGVGIGGSTGVWDASLRTLGFKPNVPALDFSSLETTYENLASHYDGKIDTAKLIDGANHGLVSALGDPYTVYFDQGEANQFSNDLSGAFSGIGAELAVKNAAITVSSVLPSSPAQKSGLQSGDQIDAINGQSTTGWSLDKAVDAIRGQAGTSVKLTIIRGGSTQDISVTRANLTDPSVTSTVTNGIGILTISRFGADTADLASAAARSFKSQNVKGVILDLRGNGGGYVDAAQAVTSLWLNNQVVVSERTNGVTTQVVRSSDDPMFNGLPTIVLIDGGSASASEITAGALHDDHAATLYGQTSFGKGSVQNVLDLPGGSELKVTIARWYTPDGKNIDKTGITPDVTIVPTADQLQSGDDPVLSAALAKLGG